MPRLALLLALVPVACHTPPRSARPVEPPAAASSPGAAPDPRAMDDENAAAAWQVVEGIVTASRSRLHLDQCRMYPGTRVGQCLLSGSPDDTRQLIAGLHLPPRSLDGDERPVSSPDTCLAQPDLGVRKHDENDPNGDRFDRLVPRPGTSSFGPGTALPPNDRNVHIRMFYTSPSLRSVCLEFHYPYG